MPRQSRGRSSSSSRAAPRAAPAAAPAQARGAHTAAAPSGYAPAHAPAPPVGAAAAGTSKPPGMFAQMAATAGSVAVGSTIGHGISNMLFGSGGGAAEAQVPTAQQQQQTNMSCEIPAKDFTLCLEKADMQSCTYYLEQLKAVCCFCSYLAVT
ncbi:hypothetical protein B0H10DRAFT_1992441 [Mycena sp. CBHHK59/15]|nr:hypothetical protein B0H10DRAFT_1992441 [Mycena sp. CBHHK59/15]